MSTYLKADVERGFVLAYYELVKNCSVSLDLPQKNIVPVVAFAHKPGEIYGMDFSSIYHFTENERSSTRIKRVRKKVAELQKHAEFAEMSMEMPCRVVYEIWCFLPPNGLVRETVALARQEDLPVELIGLAEVGRRMRQVALLDPIDEEMVYGNAFLWAASLFRKTGVLEN